MNRVPMTVEGENTLRQELARLKGVERVKVSQAIAEARALGDLKENAEYHAAREQQGFIESRIGAIEIKLAKSQVIDINSISNSGKVIFGTTVTLFEIECERKVIYKIVGDDEADIKASKISVNSPIARALIGKSVGDIVMVKTPSGATEYEIEDIQHI